MSRGQAIALIVGAIICLCLLITDRRLLVWESGTIRVNYQGEVQGGELRCTYFTGRSFRNTTFAYSDTGIMGVDQCPLLLSRSS
jgi:hypothetical protein